MNRHLKSILLLGYLPSLLLLIALIAGVQVFRSGMDQQKRTKLANYETYQENQKKLSLLEGYMNQDQRRQKMEFWDQNLDEDLLQTLSANLAEILSAYKESEIQNTAIGRPGGNSAIAAQTESKYSMVNLVFEGHYGAIQKTITELEFRMPMISLESLSLRTAQQSRNGKASPKLKIELNYLCWHKPEAS